MVFQNKKLVRRKRDLLLKKKKEREWLDIRNHGWARFAMIIPLVELGNPKKNAANISVELKKAHKKGAQVAVSPELSLTGYSLEDDFFQEALLDGAEEALSVVLKATTSYDMLISVGLPVRYGCHLLNGVAVIYGGKIRGILVKEYLAEGGIHYEGRQFSSADAIPRGSVIDLCGQKAIPIGTDILFDHVSNKNMVVGFDICEDGWVPGMETATNAALEGALVLGNCSGSPAAVGKPAYRVTLAQALSGTCCALRLYVGAGFGESTQDMTWDGHAIAAWNGRILLESERFSDEPQCLVFDCDMVSLANERRRWNAFRERVKRYRRTHPVPYRKVPFGWKSSAKDNKKFQRFLADIAKYPFVPDDPVQRDENCAEVFREQRMGLRSRLKHLGFDRDKTKKLVLLLSGGRDSGLAAMGGVAVMKELGRSPKDVICVTAPGFGTTPETLQDARDLADALGVTFLELPIASRTVGSEMCIAQLLLKMIGHDGKTQDITYENAQAWARKFVGLGVAAQNNGLLLGTGDLSELLVGWCTMHADHTCHFDFNSGVPKTLMEPLLEWVARVIFADAPRVGIVIDRTCSKIASPELTGGEGGKITQSTDEKIGPLALRDFFTWYFLRFGTRPATIARLAYQAYEGTYELAEIKKWLRIFIKRVFGNKFKSNCVADGVIVASVGVSPRGYWRFPSDADPDCHLENLESVPDIVL